MIDSACKGETLWYISPKNTNEAYGSKKTMLSGVVVAFLDGKVALDVGVTLPMSELFDSRDDAAATCFPA